MADEGREYTISEVAELTGLSPHTLRWYERIGLIAFIGREANGRRRYTAHDLDWLRLLTKLRATGMPVADMVRYAELVRRGAGTYPERQRLLEEHRERVLKAMREQQEMLRLLDHKIEMCRRGTVPEPPREETARAQGDARPGA
ncbi:MerR family transcriptional regulator [Carbonactinospora thermoautotrophica]|uniref:MerR family transcriptional regulator n=1 Tax=Carbonactinospora thermoautotrophica TaxID=1469144 RepID=UPI00226ED1CD|nr:MerR family transcriptional regulator [Carbonactinospora thermoautotrophica]MCX9192057.1 MerR family transcriptional regulator [Carbonactinospora thermoautotrophica]